MTNSSQRLQKFFQKAEKVLDKAIALRQYIDMQKHRLIYDARRKRPACLLIQIAYRVPDSRIVYKFPDESWLTFLTDDMRQYEVDERQLAYLVKLAEDGVKQGKYKED